MYDSIVIGCGAAGMTAALNILRNGKTVKILEKDSNDDNEIKNLNRKHYLPP